MTRPTCTVPCERAHALTHTHTPGHTGSLRRKWQEQSETKKKAALRRADDQSASPSVCLTASLTQAECMRRGRRRVGGQGGGSATSHLRELKERRDGCRHSGLFILDVDLIHSTTRDKGGRLLHIYNLVVHDTTGRHKVNRLLFLLRDLKLRLKVAHHSVHVRQRGPGSNSSIRHYVAAHFIRITSITEPGESSVLPFKKKHSNN